MLQIGRKLYFDTTGKLLLDTGERMGDVRETSLEEDFAVFPQLQGLTATDVVVKQLGYGDRADEFMNMGSVRLIDDVVVIYPRLTILADRPQIESDGIDMATITSDHAQTFSVDGGEEYAVNPFLFSSTVEGTYVITAKSELYGQNSVTVEVV